MVFWLSCLKKQQLIFCVHALENKVFCLHLYHICTVLQPAYFWTRKSAYTSGTERLLTSGTESLHTSGTERLPTCRTERMPSSGTEILLTVLLEQKACLLMEEKGCLRPGIEYMEQIGCPSPVLLQNLMWDRSLHACILEQNLSCPWACKKPHSSLSRLGAGNVLTCNNSRCLALEKKISWHVEKRRQSVPEREFLLWRGVKPC